MGKLLDRLNKQLKRPEHEKDAKECIEIYNWIKSTDPENRVWSSRWDPLVNMDFLGEYPYINHYSLNITGKHLLKGIRDES